VAAAIALLVPALSFLFSFARTERVELIVVSALAADTAWGWLDEKMGAFQQASFSRSCFRRWGFGCYAQVPYRAGLAGWLALVCGRVAEVP